MIKYKKIALVVGHSKLKNGSYTSSQGIKNEYLVNKELAYETKRLLDIKGQDCDVILVPEGKYTSKSYEDDYKLPIVNSGKYDLVVEFHCNCFNTQAKGTEVLYISESGKKVAQRVQNKLKTIFTDRGLKYRDDLYMLTKVKPVSIMLEVMFIDNKTDCIAYDTKGKSEVAKKIVEGLIDTSIEENVNTGFKIGTYQKDVVVDTDTLNARSGRGTDFEVVGKFHRNEIINIWYIDKDKDGDLWGSCSYKEKTVYIHMGYVRIK